MDSFFSWLSSNSVAATVLIVAFGVVVSSATIIYLGAFLQGRPISFWPPKIGVKPDKAKGEGKSSQPSSPSVPAQIADIIEAKFELKAGNAKFDFKKISAVLDEHTEEVIVVAQNLQTLLRNDILTALRPILEKKGNSQILIVLSVPEFFTGISTNQHEDLQYLEQFANTIQQLNRFKFSLKEAQKPRFRVFFHPGASSLSALIRDPADKHRGVLIFTAKWTTDTEPDSRVVCIVDRETNDYLFQRLIGHIPIMADKAHSPDLEEMIKKVARLCKDKGIEWKPL